ncbi:hypothetical protein BURCENK562V_C2074 [Burkholderia cenocepacia K56-2Valvano]|nr:hypothetical protein BURCENK562V_C2074 [Burkholderia cenocepacia K56-2Valvano]
MTCRIVRLLPDSARLFGFHPAASSFRSVHVPRWTQFAFQSSTS